MLLHVWYHRASDDTAAVFVESTFKGKVEGSILSVVRTFHATEKLGTVHKSHVRSLTESPLFNTVAALARGAYPRREVVWEYRAQSLSFGRLEGLSSADYFGSEDSLSNVTRSTYFLIVSPRMRATK